MQENRTTSMDRNETESKFIGLAVPLPFYKRIRIAATKDEMSLSGFFREALIKHIEVERK